jgi:ribosomal protein L11 methyltransferase
VEDTFTAGLWRAGTLGVEVRAEGDENSRLTAWFPAAGAGVPDPLADGWGERGVRLLAEEIVAERDWLAPFRQVAQPFALGQRFFVDPGEPRHEPLSAPEGRWPLRLPARTAFGTGSHESTRLALELLEETEVRGRRVLEVGTGTGILAFAALLLGARRVVAFDIEVGAALTAGGNLRLNAPPLSPRRRLRLFAGPLAAVTPGEGFDLVVANVLPTELDSELPAVVSHLAPGGELISSGLLAEQEAAFLAILSRLGLEPTGRRTAGEWVALRLVRGERAA